VLDLVGNIDPKRRLTYRTALRKEEETIEGVKKEHESQCGL